ncbi:MAG: hypothetical protein Q7T18_00520, partial [Sedimentisphaerales bacterium]|nr:hypothetical protein [Sedimentisphaerales bacterium]
WTWHSFWYDRQLTEQNAGACVRACTKAGLNEIFFTLWGDDGAYCDFDSALAGMAYTSELMYCGDVSPTTLARRFSAICGGDYTAVCLASNVNMHESSTLGGAAVGHTSSAFFWDDPLLSICYHNKAMQQPTYWPKQRQHYKKLIAALTKTSTGRVARSKQSVAVVNGGAAHALLLAKILYQKIDISIELDKAYRRRKKDALRTVCGKIPPVIKSLGEFDRSLRQMWLARNKPQGLEVLQIRIAGQIRRYEEVRQRLREFCAGRITAIDELEERPKKTLAKLSRRYRDIATGSATF